MITDSGPLSDGWCSQICNCDKKVKPAATGKEANISLAYILNWGKYLSTGSSLEISFCYNCMAPQVKFNVKVTPNFLILLKNVPILSNTVDFYFLRYIRFLFS